MKKHFILIVYLLISFLGYSQNSTQISLLTFETGDQSYTVFGHTGIRVKNEIAKTDAVYNFGMFDFNTPNFLAKYCTGTLDYHLGRQPYNGMLRSYFNENRQVYEQVLNLNETQTQKLIAELQKANRPENRFYRYRFLRKNCSTQVRDILFDGLEGIKYISTETDRTYRQYISDYMRITPWLKFGANLALGTMVDQKIDTNELMFLPDFLSHEIEKVTIDGKPYVGKTISVFENLKPNNFKPSKITPFIIFCFLFVVMVFGKSKFLIKTYILATGLGGLLILTVNLLSEHPEVQSNYNLLWLNPLYLVIFILGFTPYMKTLKTLHTILILGILTALGVWFSKVQGYEIAFFPIVITLLWINLRATRGLEFKIKNAKLASAKSNE